MSIDFATRFPRSTLAEAWARAKQTERWVFHDTISASVTTIYGRSGTGKSHLVVSMILSLLVDGYKFLGMEPTDTAKVWYPAILCTDPASEEDYAEILGPHADGGEVDFYRIRRTATAEEWAALTTGLLERGHNFVVLDNLMGATGDTNDAQLNTTVFDGLDPLTRHGVPVVILHHESEKGPYVVGNPPMGWSGIVQKSRAWIQVRQTNQRRLRGGNLGLIVRANKLDQPQQIIAKALPGAGQEVISRGPWETKKDQEEAKPKETRAPETLDKNAEMAKWISENCTGMSVNGAATAAAEHFDRKVAGVRPSLTSGALHALVTRADTGEWVLTPKVR